MLKVLIMVVYLDTILRGPGQDGRLVQPSAHRLVTVRRMEAV
jgi:hypothetical protein